MHNNNQIASLLTQHCQLLLLCRVTHSQRRCCFKLSLPSSRLGLGLEIGGGTMKKPAVDGRGNDNWQ